MVVCVRLILSFVLTVVVCFFQGEYVLAAETPVVGKKAADKYFQKRKRVEGRKAKRSTASRKVASSAERYLALHMGGFVDGQTYNWGEGNKGNVSNMTIGVTYRLGEWINSMDLLLRADFISYNLNEDDVLKVSLMPLIVFPDARSEFPLYFGAGIGPGVFVQQIDEESSLSLDYQALVGVRFFDLFPTSSTGIGLTSEFGIKNHIHLLSDGQSNGVFMSAGFVFTF